ncbi:MAG: anaerobic sulfatase maturase [Candidatus Marinimicrobia bacterium]|nr:anaerobic sulfatase maturase [Candidatus Neomarinimicrobiota bacterium]
MPPQKTIQIIAKPTGPLCNLDCNYCFYLEKEQLFNRDKCNGNKDYMMSHEVLEAYIHQQLETESEGEKHFVWQGGEPTLLGVDYFREIVTLQKQYAGRNRIRNSLQTNGVLLDDTWCKFLAEHDFLVGISIDGPRELHDMYRIDKAGKPTFEKVMQSLELLQKFQVEFNTLTTIHDKNAGFPLEIYHFLKQIGSRFIQFIPIVERTATHHQEGPLSNPEPTEGIEGFDLSEETVESQQFGTFLNTIFDEWIRHDVGQVFIQNFDVALEAWSGHPSSLCVFSETCGLDPVIEHNGDLYACDHFVYPEYKFGNILTDSLETAMQSPQQVKFGQDKRDTLPSECHICEYRFACHGGCPKHRFIKTEPGLNYLCSGYKTYFKHINPFMKFMANELRHRRPPANVMSWIQR